MGDVPFSCKAVGYQIAGIPADFVRINLATGQSTILTNLGITVNAIGYSVLDNFIYGMDYDTSDLIRIDSTPTVKNYGAVSNLPAGGYNVATIDLQGHLFIYISGLANYYVVDINTSSSTFGQLLDPTNNYISDTSPFGTPLSTPLNIFDWAYNSTDGQLYGVDNTTGNVIKINPTTGISTTLTTIGIPAGAYKTNFIDVDGNIYEIDSNSSLVYKITVSGNTATGVIFSTSLATIQNNNINCPLSRVLIDFGDTSDTRITTSFDNYKSILVSNGSQHQSVNQLSLGTSVAEEADIFQNPITKRNIDRVLPLPQAQENIEVNIYNPKLTLIKNANKKITAVGETVTYTITARNDGNIELSDIVINDLLSPELKFIDGSVKINNISQLTSSIISEVNIELLGVGQSKTITFDVEIISQGNGTINNISTSIFQFKPNLTESAVSGTSTSNLYSLTVKYPNLLVTKTSDKEIALLDDIITYTATISNNGDTNAINVIFKATLPNIVQFIDGTFTVKENLINSVNLNKGINIGNISVGETIIITYQVRVMSPSCQNSVTNSAYVTFGYFTSSGIINYMRSNESSVEVILAPSIFKQTNIQNYFEIPCKKPDIEQINVVTANIEIENCYAIETPIGTSIEGQQLTGYKMIIHGNIIFVIDYTADVPQQNVHSAHYCSPFSTFVILPSNFSFSCQSSINAVIEDVYSNQISNRCFFANATALITVGIR